MWLLLGIFAALASPTVAVVEQYLNKSVPPCWDFYEYSCGRWNEFNGDVNKNRGDTLSLVDLDINEKIADFLEANPSQSGYLAKMKTFYNACREVERFNVTKFLEVVQPEVGWSALTHDWQGQDFKWLDMVAELRKYGLNVILQQSVQPKLDNSSVNRMYLDYSARYSNFPFENRPKIYDILTRASIPSAEIISYELAMFEKDLHSALPLSSEIPMDSDDAEEVELSSLNKTVPEFSWSRYLSVLMDGDKDLPATVYIQNRDWTNRLEKCLRHSDPDAICDYIMLQFIQYLDKYVSEEPSRGECVRLLHHSMPLAVDYVMENNFFDPEYEHVLQEMLDFFKMDFLTSVTKMYAKKPNALKYLYTKTTSMELKVGNSKRNLSMEEVDKYYEDLHLEEGQFYKNLMTAFAFKTRKELATLKGEEAYVANQWSVDPTPFFLHQKNRIVVPLNLLQGRILQANSVGKYSILEFLIAHEFLHAFDMTGLQFDYEGNFYQNEVYHESEFHYRINCMSVGFLNDGLAEKVGDLGGVRLAYNSYEKTVNEIGRKMSGADETGRSLAETFFIDFAQFFCGPPQTPQERFHSFVPETFAVRAREALMHFDEFAIYFLCRDGSNMSPRKKCRIW